MLEIVSEYLHMASMNETRTTNMDSLNTEEMNLKSIANHSIIFYRSQSYPRIFTYLYLMLLKLCE